jgi:hypothetical protein
MGTRVRLKSSFNIGGFSPRNQVILQALKTYGMMLADNGSNWYLSGVPDSRWNNDELRALGSVVGSNFEVVDVSSLMVDPNSGRVSGGSTPPTATATPTAQPTATRAPTPVATATRTPSAIPAATATATATSTGQTQTLVIRGVALMPDTWISPDYSRTNFGSATQAHLQGSYTAEPGDRSLRPKLTVVYW